MAAGTKPLRADAARNRDKLLAAATQVFGERGMNAPLEEIARRAGVSIGTLYNHFPTRDALFEAIFPDRLAALDRVIDSALADPDPWHGLVSFLEGLFALQAQDRGLNDAVAAQWRLTAEASAACTRGFEQAGQIIERAKRSGRLRPDFEPQDLVTLVWAVSQVIRESIDTAPDTWRRCLDLFLDGLRAPESSTT
ncbi:AcrR family transcriptional regulator [Thermocatellispora tengchongensis]|uniref:AcrR family transcriptional regulator n=1 Tax=Thermocatellispora tengchongensis TaxID=1073253 RepID=A0A840P6Y5_9ACTN|nr:TetR/AcrR family transcriptional regulator [Thermocatellispora tengchongensis]MBB5135082.1 AcrR family transcriptional regulator [Thermocatellispora tengchongensis]